jgi:hypothetical protein
MAARIHGELIMDTSHLSALELRLSNERERMLHDPQNRLRPVWIAQIEREIKQERELLKLGTQDMPDLSDDELLAALGT